MTVDDGGPWIDYATAQARIAEGLPVEVLDQYTPEWKRRRFTAHKPNRLYRIPTEPSSNFVVAELEGARVVHLLPDDVSDTIEVRVPAGRWRVVLERVA